MHRSPLNVVVSGLDFLKDEVKALSGSVKGRLEGLIHEITVASKSAVHILTDVVDYELIDNGRLYVCGDLPLLFLLEANYLRNAKARPQLVSYGPILGGQVQLG